jgi:hypothetical protein
MKNINKQSQSLDKIAGLEDLDHENAAVCSGGIAILYDGANLAGPSATFRANNADLRSIGFNDKASSISVTVGEKWQLFEHVNYGGAASQVFSGGSYNLIGLNNIGSSIRKVA